jgi:hypothetical protein
MSVIEAHWRERRSRYEDGIYFAGDDFVELRGTPGDGYRAEEPAPVAVLLQSEPDGWTHLAELCSVRAGDFTVFAGSTSWEGAGFVALERRSSGRLVWLLHLSGSEPFVEVSCDGSAVRAVSEEYPFRSGWHIPIRSPESLTVSRIHDP